MSTSSNQYDKRGVSAGKEEVHAAVKNLDKGLYPKAFSRIYPDYLCGDKDFCNLMSSDGTGTKSILAYMYWKETGDLSVWRNIAVDVLVMNLDDLLCVGATGPFLYTSIINRNKHLIPGEVIAAIIEGAQSFIDEMSKFGIEIKYMGGETADLGDTVRTTTVDGSMTARMKREDLIITSEIKPGDVIVGLSSSGKATYENEYNSGIGSNGLTSARHDVLNKSYLNKYPESFDPLTDHSVLYIGSKRLQDKLEETPLDYGKALLSPTKTYSPVMKVMLEEMKEDIHSLVHCTGGGQTKVLHFIDELKIIKDNLLPTPPLFQAIQRESGTSWQEMYKVFNMGQRMEVYLPESKAQQLIAIASRFDIEAQVIGRVESSKVKEVQIISSHGTFKYQ
ncbi:AIR synthase-related protein [Chitinophagales bacterium]|nr:AIR synthase-related protein [Chitinophagales bacterium]|tara:strand:- start:12348 stop:13523 length:1176 start_codon:yes stop_codon:yes gene_type:complete